MNLIDFAFYLIMYTLGIIGVSLFGFALLRLRQEAKDLSKKVKKQNSIKDRIFAFKAYITVGVIFVAASLPFLVKGQIG